MTLQCERNSAAVEKRIRAGARQAGIVSARNMWTFYEHGQWWVEDKRTGAQWSVSDAEGSYAFNGFCFEQVSQGEEV